MVSHNVYRDTHKHCASKHNNKFISLYSVQWMKAQGTVYKIGYVVVLSVGLFPVFGRINNIIIHNTCNYYFLCNILSTISFCEHYHSFEVEESIHVDLISHMDIFDHIPL